jgi:hypothetical protein
MMLWVTVTGVLGRSADSLPLIWWNAMPFWTHPGVQMAPETYAEAGGKLREGRSQLERAQRDMARAGQQRQMAEQQADAARRAAGLTTTTSSLNVALKSMQDAAARDLANAEAANMKAKLLKPTQPEQEDQNIAQAMQIASGKPAAPTNLTDRLAHCAPADSRSPTCAS